MRATIGLLCVLAGLAVCGNQAEEENKKEPMKLEDTAFGEMTSTMDRARSVETTTMQHKEELDRALEQDGQ